MSRYVTKLVTIFASEGLAIVAARRGRARRALRLTAATAELRRTWGMAPDVTWWTLVEAATAQARGALDAAGIRRALAAGRAMTAEQALAYALDDRWADDEAAVKPLTRREFEVACLVADGLSNRELAAGLGIAERTVQAHLDNIRAKLDLQSRTQVASWAAAQARREPVTAGTFPKFLRTVPTSL